MSGQENDDSRLAQAVDEQRQSEDKLFVRITTANRHIPGLRAALELEAKESGRMLVVEAFNPRLDAVRDDLARRQYDKTVDRNDKRAILASLKDIAAGRVQVK
jgi:hypothetical protein